MNYSKLNKGNSGLMSLTGTKYGELRHNNRESGLDSQLDFREDQESSVNVLLNGTLQVYDIFPALHI